MQQRGAAVIKARKLSSAMSAAKAICDHMRDIWFGTKEVSVYRKDSKLLLSQKESLAGEKCCVIATIKGHDSFLGSRSSLSARLPR